MKRQFWLAALFLITCSSFFAQPWQYDFGTETGSFSAAGVSTSFLPQPGSGEDRIRIGSAGGSFNLENLNNSELGTGSGLRIVAASSGSVNKFSIYNYSAARIFQTKFNIMFGDSSGGATVSAGTYYFFQGSGTTYSDNTGFTGTQVFSGLRFLFGAEGALNISYRSGSSWSTLGGGSYSQASVYSFEIYGNNSSSASTYYRNGSQYSVAANRQDIWLNGIRYSSLAKSQIADNTNVNAFMVYGEVSPSNAANCFLDNIVYANSFPTIPLTQASDLSSPSSTSSSIGLSWINGSGDKRVVLINTANSFVAPQDGTDPPANPVYSSRAQQVVYNGTENEVEVSGLNPLTTYYFMVYEVFGADLLTRFNPNSAANNPASFTTQEYTLPVELSSFTAVLDSEGGIRLNWVTQSETNTFGFYVLRAGDDQLANAEVVSPLIGATNTSTQQVYQFTDESVWDAGVYYYWLQSFDLDGTSGFYGPCMCLYDPNADQGLPDVPDPMGISAIYPNPFNPSTTIIYCLEKSGLAELSIINLKGQKLRSVTASVTKPGRHSWIWDGRDEEGRPCSSGVYYAVMREGTRRYYRKMVLMK